VADRREVEPWDDGFIGWLCQYKWSGRYFICRRCGPPGRPDRAVDGWYVDEVRVDDLRPQPQTCLRCKKVVYPGVLPYLRERFRGSESTPDSSK
jgi:hypothetical protein